MKDSTRNAIQSMFESSNQGQIPFGELVGKLAGEQVESYCVDYRCAQTTYYLPDDETLSLEFEQPATGIGAAFDAGALREAIGGAQRGEVKYPEFKIRSQRAGCVGYTVWIAGRHVAYFGRKGETHIERFPD